MDCLSIPEIDLGELADEIRAQLNGKRYPLNGLVELTDRCNMNCVQCYINQSAANTEARARELTTTQVLKILDQIADAGCLFLILSGGEIFLRGDFKEILIHAQRRGLLVGLFTNGTLITPGIADFLSQNRPRWIEITLYGATRETYESITRVPGSYDRCINGVKLLLEKGLKVYLKTVLLTVNRHELDAMKKMADELGVNFRFDGHIWPRMDGNQRPTEFQLPIDEFLDIDGSDPARRQEWIQVADKFAGINVRGEYVYSCGAALQNFTIDSSGKMSGCTMSRIPSFDILELGFSEAWDKLGEIRKLKRTMDTPCQTCVLGGICAQCPGWSQVVHGDAETPVKFICDLAHHRHAQIEKWKYNDNN